MFIWNAYFYVFLFACYDLIYSEQQYLPKVSPREGREALEALEGKCVTTSTAPITRRMTSASYIVCFGQSVLTVQYDAYTHRAGSIAALGVLVTNESRHDHQVYRPLPLQRPGHEPPAGAGQVIVDIECCPAGAHRQGELVSFPPRTPEEAQPPLLSDTFVHTVQELGLSTKITVCSDLICTASVDNKISKPSPPPGDISDAELSALAATAKGMFHSALAAYMANAFPLGELRPVACSGGDFDLVKLPAVTLVDALDMLVIVEDGELFKQAVQHLTAAVTNWDYDINVSVFETTIRVLGGLVSAHLMAVDPALGIFTDGEYRDELLDLAIDLADRILPAFSTKTGIPYGTVNLHTGVPRGETKVASTAGGGSLLLEWQALSLLTGNAVYGQVALKALTALINRASPIGLLGKHVHVDTGQWVEGLSGIGSNSDSTYEYLLKATAYPSLPHDQLLQMFLPIYTAIRLYVLNESTVRDVDMYTGREASTRIEALDAFWPGLETSLGSADASRMLRLFHDIMRSTTFFPEEVNLAVWRTSTSNSPGTGTIEGNLAYPLRPEVAESTYLLYRSTGDRRWLTKSKKMLEDLNVTYTGCGYAAVANVKDMELADTMPSYFLAETLKYLYLTFKEDSYLHSRGGVVFTTEGHPIDVVQLHRIAAERSTSSITPSNSSSSSSTVSSVKALPVPDGAPTQPRAIAICPQMHYLQVVDTFRREEVVSDLGQRPRQLRAISRGTHWINAFAKTFPQSSNSRPSIAKCSVSDRPPVGSALPTTSTTAAVPALPLQRGGGVLKTVTVNMAGLGDFTVSVYNDGFAIRGKDQLLDVFNADKRAVLVRQATTEEQQPPTNGGVQLTMGSVHGHQTTCVVSTTASSGTSWAAPCSIGTFGPSGTSSVAGNVHVVSGKGTLCVPLPAAEEVPRPKTWFDHLLAQLARTTYTTDIEGSAALRDKVVLVRRGDCLFEDKARIAQGAGAKAVLIANNENALFVMAGKKEVAATSTTSTATVSGSEAAEAPADEPLTIPTVMITSQDAQALHALGSAEVAVDVRVSQDVLQTDLMGNAHYPKVWMTSKIIYVLSSSNWGAYFKATGSDWQMYLMNKHDISTHRLIPPTTVLARERSSELDKKPHKTVKLSTTPYLLHTPQEVYAATLRRKCPRFIKLRNGGKAVELLR